MKGLAQKTLVLSMLIFGVLGLSVMAAESATARQQTLPDYLQLQGVVEATNAATVSAQVSGRVERVWVEVGDEVPAGSTIVTLTSVEQYQVVRQAEAQLAASNADLVAAQQEFERVQRLVAQQLLPDADLDRVQAALDSAKAQQRSAQAAVARAQEQLSYTEVKAPYAGVVSARLVEPGELVQPGTPLMRGFDPAELRIHVDVPGTYAAAIATYQWANVAGVTPLSLRVFPTVEQRTGTQRVRLFLPADTGFVPGQWQPVTLQVGEHAGVVIPSAAVTKQGELTLVKLADGNWRAVRLGAHGDGWVEVVSGLQADEVVTYGN